MPFAAGEAATGLEAHLGPFLSDLVIRRNVSPNTVHAYEADLRQFFLWAVRRAPGEPLTQVLIRRFLVSLGSGEDGLRAAPATVARKLVVIKAFMRYLCRQGVLRENPAATLSPPCRRLMQRTGSPEADETADLPALPGGSDRALRDRAVVEVLLTTGAGLGDVRALDVDHVDLTGAALRLGGGGRSARGRVVPLGPRARSAIALYLEVARPRLVRESELRSAGDSPRPERSPAKAGGRARGAGTRRDAQALFLSRQGRRLALRSLRRIVENYVSRLAEERQSSLEAARDDLAARLLALGADSRAVRQMLGRAVTGLVDGVADGRLPEERLRAVYRRAHPRA